MTGCSWAASASAVAARARSSASASGSMPGTGAPNGSARQASNGGADLLARAGAVEALERAVVDLDEPLVDGQRGAGGVGDRLRGVARADQRAA